MAEGANAGQINLSLSDVARKLDNLRVDVVPDDFARERIHFLR